MIRDCSLTELAAALAVSTGREWYVIEFEHDGTRFEIVRDFVPAWIPEQRKITGFGSKPPPRGA